MKKILGVLKQNTGELMLILEMGKHIYWET
jgi:hypothetical protein